MNSTKKIIIADDDPAILDAITLLLEYEGYEVMVTSNAASLLTIEKERADLLLLDIWMSGTDGRDICRQLKQQENTSTIPVILISASKDIAYSALQSGADDFLAKPFELSDMLETIRRNI